MEGYAECDMLQFVLDLTLIIIIIIIKTLISLSTLTSTFPFQLQNLKKNKLKKIKPPLVALIFVPYF